MEKNRKSNQTKQIKEFSVQVADETFNFNDVFFDDPKITGLQIAMEVGALPVEDFVILQWLNSHELETIRPSELIDIRSPQKIFVIKGSETYRFVVDGLSLEWPLPFISGLTIKRLLEQEDNNIELFLEKENVADKIIENSEEVKLKKAGVEKFKIKPIEITIIVNGRPKIVNAKQISFQALVNLAFDSVPTGSNIMFTITYRKGPKENREGTMQVGTTVKIKQRMIFNVTSTDKS